MQIQGKQGRTSKDSRTRLSSAHSIIRWPGNKGYYVAGTAASPGSALPTEPRARAGCRARVQRQTQKIHNLRYDYRARDVGSAAGQSADIGRRGADARAARN